MVCKEEFLTWFKDLDSYKRIDMLCELINMCIPFELRFVASYIEEMGKHSYQELRQQALTANDIDKLDKDPTLKNQTLTEEIARHRMLINVSLLKSRNYNVANWYSKKFLRTDNVEKLIAKEKDDVVQNELLLLYTMAARHPAFSFEQKQFYNRILVQLYELRENRSNKTSTYRYPPGFECPAVYRNMKIPDSTPFPMGIPMHPPSLPQQVDFMGHFRAGWPGLTCGPPAEVHPFPHQPPLQPPQPSTSPLVCSPSQSRSGSPRPVSRPPVFTIMTSAAPTVTMPAVNPTGVVAAPGLPITTPVASVMTTPDMSVLPAMVPVPIEALGPPPPLGQSSQLSPVYDQIKQHSENDELNTTLKEEILSKPPSGTVNPWMMPSNVSLEAKQINGLRIAPSQFPPTAAIRTSIADQMQSMALTDESSHYHSSSSSSPLHTPPDTPSNLLPASNTSTPPHRTPLDKNRVNGLPNFLPSFGDTTSPPPQPAFTFPAYAPVPHQSFPHPPQPVAPHNPTPPRNHPPGCYNCGAPSHLGQDCPQSNIDDITQKNTYSVDFSPVNSDTEK